MKLDLTEIALTPGKRISYEIDEPGFGDSQIDFISENPIKGNLTFSNTHGLIYVKGNFNTTIKVECGRCLEYFDMPIGKEIEEVLPVTGETDDENYVDDADFPIFVNYILDLTELIRQYILVEIPIQPLCNESCKGICIGCGVNLNNSECKCEKKDTHNPFEKLLKEFN